MSGASSPRPFALDVTLGVFLASMAALTAPWTLGALTIPWDAKAHFYPQFVFLSNALHAGDSPFWNPYVFAGHPQIADPQSLMFAPVFLALAAAVERPSFALFDAAVFFHLAVGGVGVILYARDRGWGEIGALVAALAFAFGGSAIWRVQHVEQVMSLSWLALALWALARALERRSLGWGALAGLFAGAMALGRDQVALLGLWTLALYALSRWRAREERVPFSARPLWAGALVGALVALGPVLMSASFAATSNRPEIDFAGAGRGSLHPASLLSFFVANLFGVDGPLADFWGPPSPAWGPVDLYLARNMGALYQGALPALLFVAVIIGRGLWRAREIRFFLLGLLAATLYALGRYTPVYAAIFHVPGADLFRRPADATFLMGFFMAYVVGYAADQAARVLPPTDALGRWATLGALLALGLGMGALAFEKGMWRVAQPALATAAIGYAGAAVALWSARRLSSMGALPPLIAVAAVMGADLMAHNGPNESTAAAPSLYAALDPLGRDPLVESIKRRLAEPLPPDRRDRVELAAIDFHWPNASMVHGFDHELGYNPLRLGLFTRATGAGDHLALADQRQWAPLFPDYRAPMASWIGLRWIAAGAPLSSLDKTARNDAFPTVDEIGRVKLLDRGAPTPRVVFALRALRVDGERLLKEGRPPAFDPRTVVLLDQAARGPEPAKAGPGESPTASAAIRSYRNAEVVVDARSSHGGWVVLHDVDHPWWAAEVDGVETPILRANGMFRAVFVSAGDRRVRFVFRPFRGLAREIAARPLAALDRLVATVDAARGSTERPSPEKAAIPTAR
jgi:hypothetical protein